MLPKHLSHRSPSIPGKSALSRGWLPHRLRWLHGPPESGPGALRHAQQLLVVLVVPLCKAREATDLFGEAEDLLCGPEQLLVLRVLLLDGPPLPSVMTCRLASPRFWLIITKVERKIASSETIIVSRPNG